MNLQLLTVYLNLLLIWIKVIRKRCNIKSLCSRRWWVKPHISVNMRQNHGAHRRLLLYFRLRDHEEFFKSTRMSVQQFDYLHNLLKPKLRKRSKRNPLPTEVRLAVTLRLVNYSA